MSPQFGSLKIHKIHKGGSTKAKAVSGEKNSKRVKLLARLTKKKRREIAYKYVLLEIEKKTWGRNSMDYKLIREYYGLLNK